MTEDNLQNPESGQKISPQEFELLQKLIKTRMESGQELKFENLEGYEVPPRTQFSMLKKPAVTIKDGKIVFNMACIRLFEDVKYILPIIHEEKHKLAIIPCAEEESASVEWARKKKDGSWANKQITNKELLAKIGKFMNWNKKCRYKILGEIRMSPKGIILVFELDEAIMYAAEEKEYIDESTGETKIKKIDIKYYPDKYKGKIGMSYSDYEQGRKMNEFEDFSNYFNNEGEQLQSEKTKESTSTAIVVVDDKVSSA